MTYLKRRHAESGDICGDSFIMLAGIKNSDSLRLEHDSEKWNRWCGERMEPRVDKMWDDKQPEVVQLSRRKNTSAGRISDINVYVTILISQPKVYF